MKNLKSVLFLMMLALVLVLAACGGDADEDTDTSTPEENTEESAENTDSSSAEGDQVFTLDELSEYDGQDGNPAYVAVDGVVYDVSDVGAWDGGEHPGGLTAGTDQTDAISQSPHGDGVLEDLPVVGTLEE